MGKDKALLEFLDKPLIEHLLDRFSSMGEELLIITNDPDNYQHLDVPLYTDIIPDRGALGGLYTALSIASYPYTALVACDMPFASTSLMLHLYKTLKDSDADAVLPSTDYGPEPMHAVYRTKTCLPYVRESIDQDLWRMISWHDQAHVRILSPQETRKLAPADYTFWNLNTPEEFREAEELAKSLDSFSDRS